MKPWRWIYRAFPALCKHPVNDVATHEAWDDDGWWWVHDCDLCKTTDIPYKPEYLDWQS